MPTTPAIEIIQNLLYIPETLVLTERSYSDKYKIVEISTKEGVHFKMYYYIVNLVTKKVYYGGYEVPEGVTVALIERGTEPHIEK